MKKEAIATVYSFEHASSGKNYLLIPPVEFDSKNYEHGQKVKVAIEI